MVNNYEFPYSKIIREDGEVIPAKDHNKQENQLECLTDAVGNYNFSAGTIENRFVAIISDINDIEGDITIIQGDITAIQGDIVIIQNDITAIQGDLVLIDARVTALENAPPPNVDDLGDVNAAAPDVDDVLTFVGPVGTGGANRWEPRPVPRSLNDLSDVDTSGAADGEALVFAEGTGTGDGTWGPEDQRITVASGLPGGTDEEESFPVREIRFISDSAEGEDHEVVEIGPGVVYIGTGPKPGPLSILNGLTGLVVGRMSDDPTVTDPVTYPPATVAGDLYNSITQNGVWTFNTDISEFGNASLGNLILRINGVDVANVDLDINFVEVDREVGQDVLTNYNTQGTGSAIAGGVVTFFGGSLTLVSVGPLSGIPIDSFQQGVAQIDLTAGALQRGYNIVTLRHVTTVGTDVATLEWFYDLDPPGAPNDPDITGLDLTENIPVLKFLSGVSYYDVGSTFDLDIVGNDLLNNVFYPTSDPITYLTAGLWTPSGSILITDGSVSGLSVPPAIGEVMTVTNFGLVVSPSVQVNDATVSVTPRDPYSNYATVITPSKNFVVMSNAANSTDVSDNFRDELYRLPNTSNFNIPVAGMPGAPLLWDSTISLTTGARAGELQVYDHTEATTQNRIKYPNFDHSNPANYQPQPNSDYSALPAGPRTYYRVFRSTTGDKTNGIITFPGIAEADLGGVGLRIKVPGKTVWLDLTAPFNGGTFPAGAPLAGGSDGEGCRINSGVNSLDINGQIEFSLGAIGTDLASDRQLIIEIVYLNAGVTEITGAGAGLSVNW
jgi:hypothetical protein